MAKKLSKLEMKALRFAGKLSPLNLCIVVNSKYRRSTLLSLVGRDLLEAVGNKPECNMHGDILQPVRLKEGFQLTTYGKEVVAYIKDAEEQEAKVKATDQMRAPWISPT